MLPWPSTARESQRQENLYRTGLVWGFMKYHHEGIASGEIDWDQELLNVIPIMMEAKNDSVSNAQLLQWIEPYVKSTKKHVPTAPLPPSLGWIDAGNFSPELKAVLHSIRAKHRVVQNHFVATDERSGNATFEHEETYADLSNPDVGYRLLALFRYWNIIQYYFPHLHLVDRPWTAVLHEYIPSFIAADNETEYALCLQRLAAETQDTHVNLSNERHVLDLYFGMNYAPIEVSWIEEQMVVTGFYSDRGAQETGLTLGDVLLTVDLKPMEEFIAELGTYVPASNEAAKYRRIAEWLVRTNDANLTLSVQRQDTILELTSPTYSSEELDIYSRFTPPEDTCFKLLTPNIAYLNNGSLQRAYMPEIWKQLKETKGVIIDLRNYPTDFPYDKLGSYLVGEPTPFAVVARGSIEHPGSFTVTDSVWVGTGRSDYYRGEVILLVDESTQSSSEFHAMAYQQAAHCVVLGSTTAGADGNVSQCVLPGGFATTFTGLGILYPDGTETQQVGIVPDHVVRPTVEGIRAGRDELLEAAIQLLR